MDEVFLAGCRELVAEQLANPGGGTPLVGSVSSSDLTDPAVAAEFRDAAHRLTAGTPGGS